MSAATEYQLEADESDIQLPALAVPIGSEIDIQIATARRYPRSLVLFKQRALELATESPEGAADCTYELPPKKGKRITGPSVRFSEILQATWGNCRVASRMLDIDSRFLTAQGAFFDLESNTAITFDIKRQISDKDGNTYPDSLIATVATAAGSIALRTSTLRGIPKPIWQPIYEATQRAALCKPEELQARRSACLEYFKSLGIEEKRILQALGIGSVNDITAGKLATLRGYATAIKENVSTTEEIFGHNATRDDARARRSNLNDVLDGKPAANDGPTDDELRRDGLLA